MRQRERERRRESVRERGSYARSKSLPVHSFSHPLVLFATSFSRSKKKFNLCRAVLCSSPSYPLFFFAPPSPSSSSAAAPRRCFLYVLFFHFFFCFFLSFTYKALPGTHTHTAADTATATHVSRYFRVFAGCHAGLFFSLSKVGSVVF